MRTRQVPLSVRALPVLLALCAGVSQAQFSGSIQGVVQDPTGAVVPDARVLLSNVRTQVSSETRSSAEGNYRFVSLAPGSYQIMAEARGFNKTTVTFELQTDENLNVPVSLTVAAAAEAVEVTGEAPVLNTAESRNQLTLGT